VLYADSGARATAIQLKDWLEAAQKRASFAKTTGGLHILRHTFCSHLAMRGAPAKAIQELAGHSDLTTTMRYMHLSPAARESANRLLDRRHDVAPSFGDIVETTSAAGENRRFSR
jgi:site-specific recombinase XerD